MTSLNSKERVLTAVALAEPDRVPMDFLPNPWVLQRLHRDLGTTTHRELLERLHSDIVDLRGVVDPAYRGPIPQQRELPDGVRENFWGWRQKVMQSATGPEDSFVEFVLADAAAIEDLQRHRWPAVDWFDFSDFAARLAPWQDFAVMASGASVFQHPTFLRGIDHLLMDMAVQPEMAHWLMDRHTDFYLEFFDRMLTAARGQIDILRAADDLGTQRGLFFSPAMFRTFIKPRLKKLVDMTHSHGAKFLFHSCGAIRPLIEDLIEIGVDILDPLQAAAEGMEPRSPEGRLRRPHLPAWRHLYPVPASQRHAGRGASEVQRRIGILGAGGGYILAPCHVLQTDVPTANILAMSDAGLEYGRYPDTLRK